MHRCIRKKLNDNFDDRLVADVSVVRFTDLKLKWQTAVDGAFLPAAWPPQRDWFSPNNGRFL
jgi:hypothetical protein